MGMNDESFPPRLTSAPLPRTCIGPESNWQFFDLGEIWDYRDVLLMLFVRDLKLRYKQTLLGVVWVVLQPLLAALVFTIVFGHFARLPSDGHPYVVFVFCGLICWNLVAGIIQRSAGSLVMEARLITKVYFPRLLLPLASAAAVLVDFAVSLAVLAALLAWYGLWPGISIALLPVVVLLAIGIGVGMSLWVSALNTRYRDFAYILPFTLQIWMYASPVVYGLALVPERWRILFAINPVTGLAEGFRQSLLGTGSLHIGMLAVSALWAAGLLLTGAVFFRKIERDLAENI